MAALTRVPTTPLHEVDLSKPFPKELQEQGVWCERWKVSSDLSGIDLGNVSEAMVLRLLEGNEAHAKRLAAFRTEKGSLDIVKPNAHDVAMADKLATFATKHYHVDPEIRLVLDGDGVFLVWARDDSEIYRLHVERGDLLYLPEGCQHAFHLKNRITVLRVFQNKDGWTPFFGKKK